MKPFSRRFAVLFVAALSAVAALAGTAIAQQVNEDAIRKTFAEADVNGDGALNLDEYVGHVIYVFKRIDANGDRVITIEEAIAFNPAHNPATFKAADRNGDGRLSVGEAAGAKVIDFFEMDTNRDGVVTIEELIIYERRVAARK